MRGSRERALALAYRPAYLRSANFSTQNFDFCGHDVDISNKITTFACGKS